MTGASSSVAFNEANDVLSLHLAEIGRLDATIDALQAEQGAAKAKQHDLASQLRASKQKTSEAEQRADALQAQLEQARADAERAARKHALELRRRDDAAAAALAKEREAAAAQGGRDAAKEAAAQVQAKDAALSAVQAELRVLRKKLNAATLGRQQAEFVCRQRPADARGRHVLAPPQPPREALLEPPPPATPPRQASITLAGEMAAATEAPPTLAVTEAPPTPSSASREELRAEAAADAEAMLAERQRDFIARMMT